MTRTSAPFPASRPPRNHDRARGATFVELLAVVVVLAVLAALVRGAIDRTADEAHAATTMTTITCVRDAIVGNPKHAACRGFKADVLAMPRHLEDLLRPPLWLAPELLEYDVVKGVGWRGPYLRAPTFSYAVDPLSGFTLGYGEQGALVLHDAWSKPIVLQWPDPDFNGVDATDERYVRVVSAGPNKKLETPTSTYFPPLASCGDDLVLYLLVADQREL